MRKSVKNAILASLCGAAVLSALPPEALAGPMSLAAPAVVRLADVTTPVYYRPWGHVRYGYWRPHYRHYGYYRPYYRRAYYYPYYGYRYDPSGAIFASAALGLMGAGIAAASAPSWGWGPGWGGGWGPRW